MDFLGYVRIKVDRSKPLSVVPGVYLDRNEFRDERGDVTDPPGTVGRLYLLADRFVYKQIREVIPASECFSA